MELEYSVWQIGFIALVAGAMIGALAYRFFAPSIKQADEVKSELKDARAELNNYKTGVTQHFDKTAELVNDLAQNYVRVYQHLAEGAESLGASKSFNNLLEQHQDKAVIEVDDQSKTTEIVDDDLAVAPMDEQEETVETPIDYAEPPAETNTDGADLVVSETNASEPGDSESTVDPGESTEETESTQESDVQENSKVIGERS